MNKLYTFLTAILLASGSMLAEAQLHDCKTDELNPHSYNKSIKSHVRSNISPDSTIIVPVVFHVLEWGSINAVSDAQLLDDLASINRDFRKLNADTVDIIAPFDSIAGGTQIQFRLAQIDPDGNCTTGITRHQDQKTRGSWENDQSEQFKKDIQNKWNNPWDPSKYFNVYLVWNGTYAYAVIAGANSGVLGYAWVNEDRGLMTHEFGHWLGLRHTFSGGCGDEGDLVDDTPSVTMTTGCPVGQNTCDEGVGDLDDNIHNYLSYNSCKRMFTKGQAERMHNTLADHTNGRNNLGTLSNLIATGTADPYVYGSTPCAPFIEILPSYGVFCTGSKTSFSYNSFNADVDSVVWEFPGGNPATSTLDLGETSYTAGGKYDVILTAYGNGLSSSDTLFNAVEIHTFDGGIDYPYVESFEDAAAFDKLWTVLNFNRDKNYWRLTDRAAYTGMSSLQMRNNANALNNQIDEIVSPFIDLSSSTNPNVVSFYVAHAQKGSAKDKLEVLFSTTCGDTWNTLYSKSGTDLATTTTSSNNFIPTSQSEWRQERIVLPMEYHVSDVQFKFKFSSKLGSHLYIDDINFSQTSTGLSDIGLRDRSVRIYPNPLGSSSVIAFQSNGTEEVSVEVFDVFGRKLSSKAYGQLSKGSQQIQLSELLSKPGHVYFVKIRFDKEEIVRKVL